MYPAQLGGQLRLFNSQEVDAIHEGVVKLLSEVGMQVKANKLLRFSKSTGHGWILPRKLSKYPGICWKMPLNRPVEDNYSRAGRKT